ncbi:MAG TPA: PaaI family thioesterase [Alphaproteobacteria bacterium]|nr:PaaI family thioesterase [Alphaproteobacteria bacterium]
MQTDPDIIALGYEPDLSPVDPYEVLIGPFYARPEPEGDYSYAFRVGEQHTNVNEIAHGGMLMSFADSVVANAAFAANDGMPAVTLSMNTTFLAPGRIGDLVECRPRLVRKTREIIFVDADFQARGEVLLTVKSLWKVIRLRKAQAAV